MQDKKRTPQRKFGAGARTMIAGAAVTAAIGGWNLAGHLDAASAQPSSAPEPAPASAPEVVFPTVTPTAVGALPPIVVAPIPTLLPRTVIATQGGGSQQPAIGVLNLPQLPAFAPLPTMAPLPAIPSLPQAPSGGNGGSTGGSTGGQTSGGS